MARQYKAFISYSWADKDWGAWAHRTLETYHTPKALHGKQGRHGAVPQRLNPIFKDREEEAAGHGIGAAIEEALDHSEFLIVLCSPHSAKSQWVNREVAYFKKHRDPKKILALIVDGEPGVSLTPSGQDTQSKECFPKTLLFKIDDNLQPTDDLEDVPLAADARKAGDGKRIAKLKIAAAMLGLGLDDLLKRDDRRRTIRRRWAMGAMGLISTSMAALAFVAIDQRDYAREQLQIAEKRLERSEGLAEFMISEMRKQLDAVGRLDILDSTAQRALAYYEDQIPEGLTPDQLGRRARAMLLFGEVHNARGNLDAALAAYQKAAATTKEQLRRAPDNEQRIFDHSQSVFWVGYIAWQKGDAETARSHFTQYHDYATMLVTRNPTKEEWQTELEYSYSNLGTLAMDDGNAGEAEGWFRKSLSISSALALTDLKDIDRLNAFAQSHAWLGDALYRQLKFEDAISERKQELELYKDAHVNGREHPTILKHQVSALDFLTTVSIDRNNLEAAHDYASSAVSIAEKLLDIEPENTEFQEVRILARASLGEVLYHANDLTRAEQNLGIALKNAEGLMKRNSNVANWSGRLLARPQLILSRVYFADGKPKKANEFLDLATSSLSNVISSSKPTITNQVRYCEALRLKSLHSNGEENHWAAIISQLEPIVQKSTPKLIALLAEARLQSQQTSSARETFDRLRQVYYRHPDFLAYLE